MPTYPDMMTGSSLEEGNSETVSHFESHRQII